MRDKIQPLAERQQLLQSIWQTPGSVRPNSRPRATSGDVAVEPDWKQRLTVSVGLTDADIIGADQKAIQAAVDFVAGFGGGTVQIQPGTYRFRNAVYLRPNVRLTGSGDETVLVKEPLVETKLAEDSDWFDQEITLTNADGFKLGDGVCLQTMDPQSQGEVVLRRTLVARDGNRFKIDRPLRDNMWMRQDTTVSTLFPILTAENGAHILIEDLTIDGNRQNNRLISGNYAACIWLSDYTDVVVRNVTTRNYNGDGIVLGVCHDVLVEGCRVQDNAGMGLHPGSGSQRPIMRDNVVERNNIGIYFCWGVKFGLAERNIVRHNLRHGISIGHHDDYNIVRDNGVEDSGEVGILFREENGRGFTPKGNCVEHNRVVNTGGDSAAAIEVEGFTDGNVIAGNHLLETRGPAMRVGISLGPASGENKLVENKIEGFATPVADMRRARRPKSH